MIIRSQCFVADKYTSASGPRDPTASWWTSGVSSEQTLLLVQYFKLIAISAKQLGKGIDVLLSADLITNTQYITCYVMCDEIGLSAYIVSATGLVTDQYSWNYALR